jgi:hypothetical protein
MSNTDANQLTTPSRKEDPASTFKLSTETTDVVFGRSGNQRTLTSTQTGFYWRSTWIRMFLS